jgi:alkyl hydroperoxide reductase subunit AhpF
MPKFITDDMARQVQEVFQDLAGPVRIAFFGSQTCQYCPETRQLLEETVALSDKLSLEVYDLDADKALAVQYHVDKAPGFVLLRQVEGQWHDYGVRFAGIPSGHEFTSLVNDLVLVSNGDSALDEETRNFLKDLKSPILLQVFTTPT